MTELRDVLRPGDIINLRGNDIPWKKFFKRISYAVAFGVIAATQKKVFGKKLKKLALALLKKPMTATSWQVILAHMDQGMVT